MERLEEVSFVAGDQFSAADITALMTIDFAKAPRPIGSAGAPSADALEGCGFGAAQLTCLTQIVAKPECIDPSFANSGYP